VTDVGALGTDLDGQCLPSRLVVGTCSLMLQFTQRDLRGTQLGLGGLALGGQQRAHRLVGGGEGLACGDEGRLGRW
jgi:hypothetical protein